MSSNGVGEQRAGGNYPFYTGNPENRAHEKGSELPESQREELTDPAGYIPDDGLVQAANVALLLSQPLLLTGEPGTGKTQFAYSLAHELGFGEPLKFETKSSTEARDLFYTYDHIGRYNAPKDKADPVNYIHYEVFGEAILLANEKATYKHLLPPQFEHPGTPNRSVVLIDEVDKAPRDVPNDILNEIESMYFRVRELDNVQVRAPKELQPVIIMTSNSEKSLPDAFLRRCIYYDVPFPTKQGLRNIVARRFQKKLSLDSSLVNEAIEFFWDIREPNVNLRKPPATAELLNWLQTMVDRGADADGSISNNIELLAMSEVTLFKTREDQERAKALINRWRSNRV